ncbi:MAG: hypothetical protein ACO2PO_15740 [Candidatus Calescibacterium sp.]
MAPGGQLDYFKHFKPSLLSNILDFLFPPVSAVTGLTGVGNAKVYLIKTDDKGNPIGQPITFTVLITTVNLLSNLILR